MTLAIVVNPYSGSGRGRKLGLLASNYCESNGHAFTLILEESAEQTLVALRTEISTGSVDRILCVGGDGLFHLALPVAVEHKIPMATLAAGTGNDFARTSGSFRCSVAEIITHIYSQKPESIDVGIITSQGLSRYFCQVLSTGFDSMVNERANNFKRISGKIKYVFATALELPVFKPKSYELMIDGEPYSTKAMLVAIANGKSYGGGMLVCPDADRQDGLFDVLLLKPIPVREFIRVFPKVFKGTHITHPAVEIIHAKSVSIAANAVAYADGERIGSLPLLVEIRAGGLLTWTM